ncbi:MAG: tetratricopeptide repeat protein [Chloroflexi bacterium]|nr:tetratricopeptide repeat protein [Chloroflexota bacterium]
MPKTLKSQITGALYLLDNGEWRRAANLATRILATYPLCISAYAITARAHMGLGELGTTSKLYLRLLSADPENAEALMSLGLIYHATGARPRAASCLERAYELSPGDQRVRHALGILYYRPDNAGPSQYPLTRFALARCHLRAGLTELAADELAELRQELPERQDIGACYAESLWRGRRLEAAAEAAHSLLQQAPLCLKANLLLGKLWLNGPNKTLARDYLDTAQMLDPDNRLAQSLLGRESPLPARIATLNWDEQPSDYDREPGYLRVIDGEADLPAS